MSTSGFLRSGPARYDSALRDEITLEVQARFASRLARAGFRGRLRLSRLMLAAIRRRMARRASSPYAL